MTLTVKAKHGLVKFNPLTVSIGKIIKKTETQQGKNDVWKYAIKFNSLKQLNKAALGTLHLSVPIANIRNQTFKVWFNWGVKKIQANSAVNNALGKSDSNTANLNSDNSTPNPSKPISDVSKDDDVRKIEKVKTKKIDPEENSRKLAKYQVSPKVKKSAVIALNNYPIGRTVFIFLLIDCLVIAGAIYFRRKIIRGKESNND